MVFLILCLMCIGIFAISARVIYNKDKHNKYYDGPWYAGTIVPIILLIILGVWTLSSYVIHCGDLGILRQQKEIIAVYETRVVDLQTTLSKMIPKGQPLSMVVLNADSPIRSLTESLAVATTDLARARAKEAQAKIDIEVRKIGPTSFIVSWVGEK